MLAVTHHKKGDMQMKKLFAVLLSIVMVVSLSAAATATAPDISLPDDILSSKKKVAFYGPCAYNEDYHVMTTRPLEYGDAVYYLISYVISSTVDETLLWSPEHFEDIAKLKIGLKYEQGAEYIHSASIVKMNISGHAPGSDVTLDESEVIVDVNGGFAQLASYGLNHAYFLKIQTLPQQGTGDGAVVAAATLDLKKNKKAYDPNREFDNESIDLAFSLLYENNWYGGYYKTDYSNLGELKADTKYLIRFDVDDDAELEFGLDGGEGSFEVPASSQGKILLEMNTNPFEPIALDNPGARLKFLNFNNTAFNRTGDFTYEDDSVNYVYLLNQEGKLELLDESTDGELSFRTRVLGSLIFSDKELTSLDYSLELAAVTSLLKEGSPKTPWEASGISRSEKYLLTNGAGEITAGQLIEILRSRFGISAEQASEEDKLPESSSYPTSDRGRLALPEFSIDENASDNPSIYKAQAKREKADSTVISARAIAPSEIDQSETEAEAE